MKTKDLLKFFDITLNEFEIYRLLLEGSPKTIAEISSVINIPRASVYDWIESLTDKNLVHKITVGRKRKFVARDPIYLQNLVAIKNAKLSAEQREIEIASSNLDKLINQLEENGKSYFQAGMKVLTNKKAIASIYDEITKSKEIRSFLNSDDVVNIFPENAKKFSDAVNNGSKSWAIFSNNKSSHDLIKKHANEQNYYYKFFPKNFNYKSMDYLIYSGKIAIVERSLEPIAYVIENQLLYENSKALFDLIWAFLEE